MTADLLVSTYKFRKVGTIHDDCFTPVVGNDPYAKAITKKACGLVTACEGLFMVYQDSSLSYLKPLLNLLKIVFVICI